jgi:DNA-binding NtrC family response regulator
MKYEIMFVDDSISVLESLKWIFMDEPYNLFAFDSPIDALNVIELTDIAVVVADQFMHKMDVLEFLKNVNMKSPYTMGIIMTGYNGIKETFDTIYPGFVYQFVKKPLDNIDIKQAVKTAIDYYEINSGGIRQAVYHKQ